MKTAMVSPFWASAVFVAMLTGTSKAAADRPVDDATQWHVDVVDASGPGKYTSLKVDKFGNVQVVYSIEDGNRYPLKYAIWSSTSKRWFTMQVATGAGACSMTLDSQQRPHVSWADYGSLAGAKLRYAHWDGKDWNIEPINLNAEVISYYNSIVLDAKDHPAISFYEYQGPRDTNYRIRLRSVIWDGRMWDLRTVDPEPGSGKFNAMAIDSKGHLHIGYANVSAATTGMRYAFWNGQSWKSETIEGLEQTNGDGVGFSAAIAVDKADNPHVTYMNETHPMVKYAVRKGGHWLVQTVDTLAGIAYPDRNSIALTDNGVPYIGYYDSPRGTLKVAHQEGSKWIAEIVDNNSAGFTSSIDIADGTIWISYADEHGALKVAHRKLAAPNPASGSPAQSGEGKN